MRDKLPFTILVFIVLALLFNSVSAKENPEDDRMIDYRINVKSNHIAMYWKDDKGNILRSIQHLKTFVENSGEELVFATNGGMYKKDNSPLGLFIQDYKIQSPLNILSGKGNFYMKPNGVFYITKNGVPVICRTKDFKNKKNIKYATQSGPMLVIDGQIHPSFKDGSVNLNIRNGVGILPDNRVVFAMSKKEINFYDFAKYFQSLGCKYALYLDGHVSRTYLPEKNWIQTDGNFGVIIGVTKPIKK